MVSYNLIEKILQTYDFLEILELNDLTEVDALYFLCKEEYIELPDPKPVDFL